MRRLFSISKRWFPVGICMLLYLVTPVASRAEVSLTFIPMEESKYLVKGKGFEGITAVNLTVDYDTTYLFFPQVDVMGGGLLEKDRGAATSPGSLQLHIQREDPNAAFEATIYFQKRGPYDAIINFVTAEVADLSGSYRPVDVEMVKPSPSMNEPDAVEAAPVAASASPEAGAETSAAPPVPQTDSVPAAPAEPKKKTVAERFREFGGKKSLAAFTALFSGADPCCRQTPPVVISDGKRLAQVAITGVKEGNGAPLCTVSNGQLISVKRGAKEEWIVVVRPDEKGWDVRVNWTVADETFDFPLTVAPAIEIPRHKLSEINEKTFMPRLRSFLAGKPGRGKPKSPVWFREYLFTANYLAAQGELESKTE